MNEIARELAETAKDLLARVGEWDFEKVSAHSPRPAKVPIAETFVTIGETRGVVRVLPQFDEPETKGRLEMRLQATLSVSRDARSCIVLRGAFATLPEVEQWARHALGYAIAALEAGAHYETLWEDYQALFSPSWRSFAVALAGLIKSVPHSSDELNELFLNAGAYSLSKDVGDRNKFLEIAARMDGKS